VQNAFQSLLKHWGLAIPDTDGPAMSGMSVCEWAPSVGYRCYNGRGNWTTLKHLNRPAVLELIDDRGRRHYVAAMQIKDQAVLLDFGESQLSLSRNDLDPFWFGDFTLIWEPPPIKSAILKKGDSGPDVRWLKAQLNRIEGVNNVANSAKVATTAGSDGTEEAVFDDILEMRVMNFQRSYAVEADGIVGEQTLIQLTKAEREAP